MANVVIFLNTNQFCVQRLFLLPGQRRVVQLGLGLWRHLGMCGRPFLPQVQRESLGADFRINELVSARRVSARQLIVSARRLVARRLVASAR